MKKSKHSIELCSRIVKAGHRVYFVDAKVDVYGQRFVAISELKHNQGNNTRERQRVHIYEEDMPKFLDAMGDALTALAEERKARAGMEGEPTSGNEPTETIKSETAETLGLSTPAQVDIPALDEIINKEE